MIDQIYNFGDIVHSAGKNLNILPLVLGVWCVGVVHVSVSLEMSYQDLKPTNFLNIVIVLKEDIMKASCCHKLWQKATFL